MKRPKTGDIAIRKGTQQTPPKLLLFTQAVIEASALLTVHEAHYYDLGMLLSVP